MPRLVIGFIASAVSGVLLMVGVSGCQKGSDNDGVAQRSAGELPKLGSDGVQPRIDASTYFAHGHLLERQGAFDAAEEQYRLALQLSPGFAAARNRLGITLNKLGRHAEASEQFQLALVERPGEPYLLNNLGFSLYLQEDDERAARTLESAVEAEPDFGRARMNLGVVYARLGRYVDAWDQFRMVGSDADAYYNLAVIQTEAGAYAEATRSLDQALALDPNMRTAREQLRVVARLAAEQEALAAELIAENEDADRTEMAAFATDAADESGRSGQSPPYFSPPFADAPPAPVYVDHLSGTLDAWRIQLTLADDERFMFDPMTFTWGAPLTAEERVLQLTAPLDATDYFTTLMREFAIATGFTQR